MGDEGPGPDTDCYKQTRHNRRNSRDNHNFLLLGRRISIEDHRGGRASLCKVVFREAGQVMKGPRENNKHL